MHTADSALARADVPMPLLHSDRLRHTQKSRESIPKTHT